MDVKICIKCGRELPATLKFFFKQKNGKFGIGTRCKECYGYKFRFPIFRREAKAGCKICTRCGRELFAIPEYFNRNNSGRYGLDPVCRECHGYEFRLVAKEGYRICSKCGEELPATYEFFSRNATCKVDGLNSICKICKSTLGEEYHRRNKEEINRKGRERYSVHREQKNQKARKQYAENRDVRRKKYRQNYADNILYFRERSRERRKRPESLEWERVYGKNRRANDPKYRLRMNISCGIRNSLRANKGGRHWESLVGYTLADLIKHLESLFESWMTWDNYGREWSIDHVIPVAFYNFISPRDIDFRRCWALENLRPLAVGENCSKGARLEGIGAYVRAII